MATNILWFGDNVDNLVPVKAPTVMSIVNQDYDSSSTSRTANGKMVRTVVRGGDNNVRKIQLEWRLLSQEEGAALLEAVKNAYTWCKYPDPQTGALRTMQCYVGDRTTELRRYEDGRAYWGRISFNLTEV
jgi:hypothetical protein